VADGAEVTILAVVTVIVSLVCDLVPAEGPDMTTRAERKTETSNQDQPTFPSLLSLQTADSTLDIAQKKLTTDHTLAVKPARKNIYKKKTWKIYTTVKFL
jgi:hypothetical protein